MIKAAREKLTIRDKESSTRLAVDFSTETRYQKAVLKEQKRQPEILYKTVIQD
jgi:hypothetical protein